jgi:glycosyltransferase involved in cell wall biosynthesis
MNIALVNSEYPSSSGIDHGGIATYTYSMANALASRGHTVHVLAKSGTVPDRLVPGVLFQTFASAPAGGLLRHLDFFGNGQVIWERSFSRSLLNVLLDLYASGQLDIAEIPEYNGLAWEFKGELPFPLVLHLHMPTYLVDKYNGTPVTNQRQQWYKFEERATRRARAFVSPSDALKNELVKTWRLPEAKIKVIRHCIDSERFDRIAIDRAAKKKKDILFVGRLERRKGAEILLKATKGILSIHPEVHLTVAGETSLGESLDYRLGIEHTLSENERERVWFLGPVRPERLPVLYRNSDYFIFPSLFENAPYALFDAMAAELPIVAGDTGGVNEIIRHGDNGLLFAPGDADACVSCLRSMIENPAKAQRMAHAAHTDIQTLYSPEAIVNQTIDFYQTLVRHTEKDFGD